MRAQIFQYLNLMSPGTTLKKGKPLMNSVTSEGHSLETILPLVKEYQAAVIGLVIDDEGRWRASPRNAGRDCCIPMSRVG